MNIKIAGPAQAVVLVKAKAGDWHGSTSLGQLGLLAAIWGGANLDAVILLLPCWWRPAGDPRESRDGCGEN